MLSLIPRYTRYMNHRKLSHLILSNNYFVNSLGAEWSQFQSLTGDRATVINPRFSDLSPIISPSLCSSIAIIDTYVNVMQINHYHRFIYDGVEDYIMSACIQLANVLELYNFNYIIYI